MYIHTSADLRHTLKRYYQKQKTKEKHISSIIFEMSESTIPSMIHYNTITI